MRDNTESKNNTQSRDNTRSRNNTRSRDNTRSKDNKDQTSENIALIKTVKFEKRMTQTYIVLIAINVDVFDEKDEMNNFVRLIYIYFVLLIILSFDNDLR